MAFSPGNTICGTATKLYHTVSLIPWAKRNGCLSSVKDRYFSTLFPVKYVSKNSTRSEERKSFYVEEKEGHNGLKMNVARVDLLKNVGINCLDIEPKNHGPACVSNINHGLHLEVEEEFEDELTTSDDEFIEGTDEVAKGSRRKGQGIQTSKSRQDVEKSAIKLLANRAYTAVELKKKLQGKKLPLKIVDAVITDFQSRGLINDGLYAETFSRSRWSSSSWGPRRIKQALFKKGVSEVDSKKAVELVFENGEADEEQNPGISMSKLALDQLYVQASKQWLRSQNAPWETRKSRIVRWLQYRGFNWSIIKYVLKKLEKSE